MPSSIFHPHILLHQQLRIVDRVTNYFPDFFIALVHHIRITLMIFQCPAKSSPNYLCACYLFRKTLIKPGFEDVVLEYQMSGPDALYRIQPFP